MFLSALVLPKQLGVTHKIHTTPCCIAFAPSMMGSNVAECRGPAAISLPLCRLRTQSKGTSVSWVTTWMNNYSVSNQDIALVGKKCRDVPTRSHCRICVGKKRSSSGVKQSPGFETRQVKTSSETIILIQEGHRGDSKSPDHVNWSLLRRARCWTAGKHGLIP